MRKERDGLHFRPGDAVAIAAVTMAALLMMIYFLLVSGSERSTVAQIYQEGRLIREVRLEDDAEFTVEGEYRNVITVRDGRIAVTESDCPGEDCVRTGWAQRPGRGIVCLPNRMEIRITGVAEETDVDAVVK